MKKFTVIMPTYNSGSTLAVSLESIAQQTCKDIEVLIIDGISEDDTLEIAKSFQEKLRGLVIYSEKDKGIYDAMNKGIDRATGKWLLFLGSDDTLYNPNVLEKVHGATLDTSKNVLYGNAHIVGDTGWAMDGEVYDGVYDLPKLLNQNICHQAMFYNRKFVQNKIGKFNTAYKKSSDWDFNLRCWAKGSFQYVDMIIANFVAGGISTHSNDTAITEDFVNNVRSYFKIDLFHPLLNNPKFVFFGEVLRKQKAEHPMRWKFGNLKKRISSKIRRILK